MNDLISRKELLEKVIEANPMGGMIGGKFIEDLIKKQPAAYDVDKVVEQLEKLKSIRSMKDYISAGIVHDYVDIKEVIEIVKGGGIDE